MNAQDTNTPGSHNTDNATGTNPKTWLMIASTGLAITAAATTMLLFAVATTSFTTDFNLGSGARLAPLATAVLALTAVMVTRRGINTMTGNRLTGYAALGALAGTALFTALAPNFTTLLVASALTGAVAGIVINTALKTLLLLQTSVVSLHVVVSALIFAVMLGLGFAAISASYGWRGLFAHAVLIAGLAAWAFVVNVKVTKGTPQMAKAA